MRNALENLSKNTGDDFKFSDNFKNAITLPEKVTPPINTVKEVINIKIFISDVDVNSDHAKKKEDKPPKPLNNATISGIEVIFTLNANRAPILPPSKIATKTSIGLIMLVTVTKIAKNIPMEDTRLPLAAELS